MSNTKSAIKTMDVISENLEKLTLNTSAEYHKLSHCFTSLQKCYVQLNYFKSLNVNIGSPVLIQAPNHDRASLCKIFPKTHYPENYISYDDSLSTNVINGFSGIKPVKYQPASRLTLTIIFENLEAYSKWSENDRALIDILKRFVLRYFIVCENSQISLQALPEKWRFGISKIIIHGDDKSELVSLFITEKTKLTIQKKDTEQYTVKSEDCDDIYGMENYIDRISEIIELNEKFVHSKLDKNFPPTKQILLVGPSGCGKSSIIKLLAIKFDYPAIPIQNIDFKDPGETEAALRKLFDNAFQFAKIRGKCIISIDDIDNICPKETVGNSHIQRKISQLSLLLDKVQLFPGVIVLASTNKPHRIDPSIRRYGRLETEIYIGAPTENQRFSIIHNLCSSLDMKIKNDERNQFSRTIAKITPGFVGADLRHLFQLVSLTLYEKKNKTENMKMSCWLSMFKKALLEITPASLKGNQEFVKQINTGLEDIAGIDEIKKSLEMAVLWPLKHKEAFKRMGLQRPRGILLYGPPGCAKTSLVRALSNIGLLSLLSISAAELYSPYVGDAERLICEMFDRARQNSPCILFIDEIDALAGSRCDGNGKGLDVQERIIAALLTQMDGLGKKLTSADTTENKQNEDSDSIIVIGATNRPDMIDNALLRPGRFDRLLHVPPPDYKSRREILKFITKSMPLADDCNLDEVAMRTDSCSGADLKNICTEAALKAMSERGMSVEKIQQSDFSSVLLNFRPSLTDDIINQYKIFELNKGK